MTSRRLRYAGVVVLIVSLAGASFALASGGHKNKDSTFRAKLIGYNEVPLNNTAGHAKLALNVTDTTITFKLDYADLSGPPGAAHIHIGQKLVNGGVSVFFCGGGGKPACPASTSGSVSGTITAADVVGPTAQGYAAGDITPVIAALRAGFTYANMHSVKFPNGEIRGQIVPGEHGHDGHDGHHK
jgi:CHRD domain